MTKRERERRERQSQIDRLFHLPAPGRHGIAQPVYAKASDEITAGKRRQLRRLLEASR